MTGGRALIAAAAMALSACASLPPCPQFGVRIFDTAAGRLFVLTEQDVMALVGRMQQIHERSCDPEREEPAPAVLPPAPVDGPKRVG